MIDCTHSQHHNINNSQCKNSTNHPGFEPGTFQKEGFLIGIKQVLDMIDCTHSQHHNINNSQCKTQITIQDLNLGHSKKKSFLLVLSKS